MIQGGRWTLTELSTRFRLELRLLQERHCHRPIYFAVCDLVWGSLGARWLGQSPDDSKTLECWKRTECETKPLGSKSDKEQRRIDVRDYIRNLHYWPKPKDQNWEPRGGTDNRHERGNVTQTETDKSYWRSDKDFIGVLEDKSRFLFFEP